MLIVNVVSIALLLATLVEVSLAQKLGNGYYNHIVYLNGGNTDDAWKMLVLNGPKPASPAMLKVTMEPPSAATLIPELTTMEEQNTISDVEYPTPVSYQQILPNPGIIRDNSDQLLDLLTKHIVERLQTRYSSTSEPSLLQEPSLMREPSSTSEPVSTSEPSTPIKFSTTSEPSTTTEIEETPSEQTGEIIATSDQTTEDSFEHLVKRPQQRILPQAQQTTTNNPTTTETPGVEQYTTPATEQSEPILTPSNQDNGDQQFELLFKRLQAAFQPQSATAIVPISTETSDIEQLKTEQGTSVVEQFTTEQTTPVVELFTTEQATPAVEQFATDKTTPLFEQFTTEQTTPAVEQFTTEETTLIPTSSSQQPDNNELDFELLLQRLQERLQPQAQYTITSKPVTTEALEIEQSTTEQTTPVVEQFTTEKTTPVVEQLTTEETTTVVEQFTKPTTPAVKQFTTEETTIIPTSSNQQPDNNEINFELLLQRLQERLQPQYTTTNKAITTEAPEIEQSTTEQTTLVVEQFTTEQSTPVVEQFTTEETTAAVEQFTTEETTIISTSSNQQPDNNELDFELLLQRLPEQLQPQPQYTTTSNLITTDAPEIEQSTTLATEQTTPVSMPSLRYQPTDNDDQYVEYLLNRLQERLHPQTAIPNVTTEVLEVQSITTPDTEQSTLKTTTETQITTTPIPEQITSTPTTEASETSEVPQPTEPEVMQTTPIPAQTILLTTHTTPAPMSPVLSTTEAPVLSTTISTPPTQHLLPDTYNNPDNTDQLFEILTKRFQDQLRSQYSDWLAPLNTKKVLENEQQLVPAESKPSDNLDNILETNDLLADLPTIHHAEKSQDMPIIIDTLHKNQVPVSSKPFDNLDNKLETKDLPADLPAKFLEEETKDAPILIDELQKNLGPVASSKPFDNLDTKLETNDLSADLPAILLKEETTDAPILIDDLHKNIAPVARSRPFDNLGDKLVTNDLQADLPAILLKEESKNTPILIDEQHNNLVPEANKPFGNVDNNPENIELPTVLPTIQDKEKSQDTPIIINEYMNSVPVESKPSENMDNQLETSDLHADRPAILLKEESTETPILIDELHNTFVPEVNKPFGNVDNNSENTDVPAVLPTIHHTEKSQDTPITINEYRNKNLAPVARSRPFDNLNVKLETNDLHADLSEIQHKEKSQDTSNIINENKNQVPVARSRPFNLDNVFETKELRDDLMAKKHKGKLQDTPIIIDLQQYQDTDLPVLIQNPLPGILDTNDLHADILFKHLAEKTHKIPIIVDLQQVSEPELEARPHKTSKLIEKLVPNYPVQSKIDDAAKRTVFKTMGEIKPIQRHAFNGNNKISHSDHISPLYVPDIKDNDVYSIEEDINDYLYDSLDSPKLPKHFLPSGLSPEIKLRTHNSGIDEEHNTVNNQYFNRRPLPSLSKPIVPLRPEIPHKSTVFSSPDYAGDGFIASAPGVIATSIGHEPEEFEEDVSADEESYWKPYLTTGLNRPTYNLPPSERIGTGGYYMAESRDRLPLVDKTDHPYNRDHHIITVNSGEDINDYWA